MYTNLDGITYTSAQLTALFTEAEAEQSNPVMDVTVLRVSQRTGLSQHQVRTAHAALTKLAAMSDAELGVILRKCAALAHDYDLQTEAKRHLRKRTGSGAQLNARLVDATHQLRVAVEAELERRA